MKYDLECLLNHCGFCHNNLVKMQEHLMSQHGFTQNDVRNQSKREIEGGYIYSLPTFGKTVDWMKAVRSGGNSVDMI